MEPEWQKSLDREEVKRASNQVQKAINFTQQGGYVINWLKHLSYKHWRAHKLAK
jgi:hypothetical protein